MNGKMGRVMEDRLAPILNDIATLLAKDEECPLDRTLLYADVEPAVVGLAIFKDMGDHILYRRPRRDGLGDLLEELWEEFPSDKRWVDIEYFIRDGKFDVVFVYPEEMNGKAGSDRREEVLHKYYGDKPVVYPPWPMDTDDGFELGPDNL